MNPQRVFPLLVVVSKEMIERAAKKQVEQRQSGSFNVELESPIEVEPVLPGCYLYPPKASARLGSEELALTFYVVPHVYGEVTGARVSIRQDHAELATIDLDIRVVRKTWAVCFGALTVGLPFVSALARHSNVDVAGSTASLKSLLTPGSLVQNLPILGLVGILAVITLLLYWFSRARQQDAFWDITPITVTEKLKQIAAELEKHSDRAGDDLMYLLEAHPGNQLAWLLFADWHFRRGNWREAVDGYDKAFRLGSTEPRHYCQATRAALSLQEVSKALHMLYRAKANLSPEEMAKPAFTDLWTETRRAEVPA
jgi:hypothetical protein